VEVENSPQIVEGHWYLIKVSKYIMDVISGTQVKVQEGSDSKGNTRIWERK
jgi:hypothetical protein